MRKMVLVLVTAMLSSAFCYVTGYHVEPVKAAWSGWAAHLQPNNNVSEIITCNFDEPVYAEFFSGVATSQTYQVQLLIPGTSFVVATGDTYDSRGHKWIRTYFKNTVTESIIKGRTYEVRWTLSSGPDSLMYYYDSTDCYKYGGMAVGQQVPIPNPYDLACRVYGRMNPVSDVWRACLNHWNYPPPDTGGRIALAKARSMGIKWVGENFMGWSCWDWYRDSVMRAYHRYVDSGFSMMGILCYGSKEDSESSRGNRAGNPENFVPRYLWPKDGQTNYWAEHCREIMDSMDAVKYWEVWPEQNAQWHPPDPDTFYRGSSGSTLDLIDTWRERCSLYVRLCNVAESVAQVIDGDTLEPRRKIIAGGAYRLLDDDGGSGLKGVDWLWNVFDLAEHSYGGVEKCFDIVSVHPYMHYVDQRVDFIEDTFRINLDTARWVMRQFGYSGMELWATEYGWPRWNENDTVNPEPITDTLMQADNIAKFLVSAVASQSDPRGGYDRAFHYELTSYRTTDKMRCGTGGFGFLYSTDTMQPRQPNSWAFEQVCTTLVGKRLNGLVMFGGTKDDSVKVYEFDDPACSLRTWVCWKNDGLGQGGASVELPATADTLNSDSLAYHQPQQSEIIYADADGWLPVTLDERPVFITEGSAVSRPDVIVDSLRLVPSRLVIGSPVSAYVYFHNAGSDTTPLSGPLSNDYTWVVLRHNGDSVAEVSCHSPLAPDSSGSVTFNIDSVPSGWHGMALFDATANYEQKYVEQHTMDDNDGYSRNRVVLLSEGDLIGEFDGMHSNAPLPLLAFESRSKETDTTGQTPCDSARLIQWWYGLNDSVVVGGDTTEWFDASAAVALDTSWLYLSGQGKYRLFLQVKDSWSMSDLISDTTHPFVVFDTTGPLGSIVINDGARFAPSSTCTLALAACDSASGVGWMRFMNRPPVDLVENGGFLATAGSWSFTNGAYDTGLAMAKLSAGAPQSGVSQFVPAESISAYAGDSCVLEANILAHVHEGEAAGEVSFWYWSTRADTSQHDTLWELVDSASYSGDLLSLTGRHNLSTRFLLEPPTPESGWVWRGGMVRVRAQGVDSGMGYVYTDNVALNAFEPESGYCWWCGYDTLAEWDIGSGAGTHIVRALFLDSAGNENAAPYADTVILDPTAPVVHISLPDSGQLVSGTVEVTGWAYDPVEVPGDTWFRRRTLSYRHVDSTNWQPVSPDSFSNTPAYPDSGQILGPAVHLGYWNTDSVPDGEYYVLLNGTDSAGHVAGCTTWVVVSNSGGGGGEGGGPPGGGSGMGEGSLFVGSATGYVLHLSDDLDSLGCFQVTDSGSQAKVTAILGVGNDSLLVLDAQGKRVHKLHKNGQNRRRLVSNLSQPMGLTRDANGNFWLVDKGLHKIGKFRSSGTLVFTRGGLGDDTLHFHSPEGIAVKGSLVYVADTKNDRISVWDTCGNHKAIVTGGFENPTAVLIADSGAIYLTDGNDGKLKGITPLGGNIVAIKTADSIKLRGLVLSENRHHLFSLAPQPNKVHKLRIQSDDSAPGGQQSAGNVKLPKTLSLAQPFPNPARTRLNIAYALPHQTRVVLKLYDVAGKLVKTLANGEQKPGYYNLTWNRQDAKGRNCACGVYFCTLTAENQRFSRKVVLTE